METVETICQLCCCEPPLGERKISGRGLLSRSNDGLEVDVPHCPSTEMSREFARRYGLRLDEDDVGDIDEGVYCRVVVPVMLGKV